MNTLYTNNSNALVSELKHLAISIDKEITNEVNQQIIKITEHLAQQWQNDKVLSTFIKMIKALSDYAASKKNNLHEDTTPLIRSLIKQMENLSQSPGINLPLTKKQAILSEEISKYKQLQQIIKSTQHESTLHEESSGGVVQSHSEASFKYGTQGNIISELKSIILSLDWEITDDLIQKLEKEANKLQIHWQNSKLHLSFLQMFKSIGSYVLSKGSNTHPDSISLLHSLYKNFENIVLNPNMTIAEQKEILLKEMKKFNELKQTISSANTSKFHPQVPLQVSSPEVRPEVKRPEIKRSEARPSISPMDDLMGTKVSNLSPVDDLIEEIHMLQDSGSRTHSLDANTVSQGSGTPSNPEIKEVIPNRLKKQPIPEIQTRLDAFFDEDEPLAQLSFADSGEEVVPYTGTTTSSDSFVAPALTPVATPPLSPTTLPLVTPTPVTSSKQISSFKNDDVATVDGEELTFEDNDDPSYDESLLDDDSSLDMKGISFEEDTSTSDGMVPYDFDDEVFDEEINYTPSAGNQKKQASNMKKSVDEQRAKPNLRTSAETSLQIAAEEADAQMAADMQQTNWDVETPEYIEILEELKSAVGKCMLHCGINEIKAINDKITVLEQLCNEHPEKLIMFKIVKSLTGYFNIDSSQLNNQPLEFMLYIVESMEGSVSQYPDIKVSGNKSSEKTQKNGQNRDARWSVSTNSLLIDVFSKYIDLQNTMIKRESSPSFLKNTNHQLNHENSGDKKALSESNRFEPTLSDSKQIEEQTETLGGREVFYGAHTEDTSEIENKIIEPKGFWSKIKRWLGF